MLKTIQNYIQQHSLLTQSATQLVALSGGADSVCLLLVLKRLGYEVHAVHCNFHLRGEESNRDEEFCKTLCKQQDVPLHLTHFDTKAYASLHKISIEMAARNLRYAYFEQLRQAIDAENVVVAHHKDDNIETVLLNLLRGTGITGLCGMRPKNEHVVRPLLCVGRSQIEQWLAAEKQTFITDSTNLIPDVKRNKLRLQIIPLLKQINPSVGDSIIQTAENLIEAETVLKDAINKSVQDVADIEQDFVFISIPRLKSQVSPEQTLYSILSQYGFSGRQVREISKGLERAPGKKWQSENYTLVIDREKLILGKTPAMHGENPVVLTVPLAPIKISGNEHTVLIQETTYDKAILKHNPREITIQADAIQFPLVLRYIQKGDTFNPFGMKGRKLVSDYLTDRKRNYFQRANQLVLADARGELIWLVGESIANSVAVRQNDAKLFTISLTKNATT